jgi:hypothetical protein
MLCLDWLRNYVQHRPVEGLRLFVPQGTRQFLRERLLALSPAARTEIYELRDSEAMVAQG